MRVSRPSSSVGPQAACPGRRRCAMCPHAGCEAVAGVDDHGQSTRRCDVRRWHGRRSSVSRGACSCGARRETLALRNAFSPCAARWRCAIRGARILQRPWSAPDDSRSDDRSAAEPSASGVTLSWERSSHQWRRQRAPGPGRGGPGPPDSPPRQRTTPFAAGRRDFSSVTGAPAGRCPHSWAANASGRRRRRWCRPSCAWAAPDEPRRTEETWPACGGPSSREPYRGGLIIAGGGRSVRHEGGITRRLRPGSGITAALLCGALRQTVFQADIDRSTPLSVSTSRPACSWWACQIRVPRSGEVSSLASTPGTAMLGRRWS